MSETVKNPLKTAFKLSVVAVAMFGFGYLLVPIYDVFCEITGLDGRTGEVTQAEVDAMGVDRSREVRVELDANVRGGLAWDFAPLVHEVRVHPGAIGEVTYYIENRSDQRIVARAVPSVSPGGAAIHFNKTECFCFTDQTLEPGERREMPVRFVVDPRLADGYKVLTLSYTFFESQGSADRS